LRQQILPEATNWKIYTDTLTKTKSE